MATVQNIRDNLEIFKRDISDVPNDSFILWCDFINRYAYRQICDADPERFITTDNYTVTTSPQTQALPSDFESIQDWGTGFFYLDDNSQPTPRRLTRTGYGSSAPGYYITGTNVVFTGIDATTTFTLRHIPSITTLSALSDTLVIPDRYNNYMVKAVTVLYEQWDEQPGAESFADQRFMRALDEMMDNIRKEPYAFAMGDFSNTF